MLSVVPQLVADINPGIDSSDLTALAEVGGTLFFQATSIFLILFSLQLLLYAFHEFTEAEALPLDNSYWHIATEEWAEGKYARIYSALMVLAPLAWAGYASLRARMKWHDNHQ